MLQNQLPIFSTFGQDIMASDIVSTAISCIVDEMIKCKPMHVKQIGKEIEPQFSEITKVLEHPNDLMTTADFISKIVFIYETKNNVFIYPQFEFYMDKGILKRKLVALFPLNPSNIEFYEDDKGNLYTKFYFLDGSETEFLPYEYLIHWRKNYFENEYMGGNIFGKPNLKGILKTLEINNTLLESLPTAIKNSYSVNGVIKYGSVISQEKLKENLEKFNLLISENKSGIVATDMSGDFMQLNRDIKIVDEPTLKFINSNILSFFKVPLPIFKGEFTPEEHSAFIQNKIEPMIVSLNQAFTKGIFTKRESLGFGNKINFFFDMIETMSTEQKIKLIQELGGRGALTNNYMLSLFGIPPYPEGNVRYMSLNYIDVNLANEYQINKSKGKENEKGNDNQE